MIKKLSSLTKDGKSRFLIAVSLRSGERVYQIRRTVSGPKWRAKEKEAEFFKELKERASIPYEFTHVNDIFDFYVRYKLKRKKSYHRCVCYINQVKKHIGHWTLNDITPERLQHFLLEELRGVLGQQLAGSTINRFASFIRAAVYFAVRMKKLPASYKERIVHERLTEYERDRTLSDEEWKRLQAVLPDDLRPIVTFAYLVPSRAGELMTLRKEWISGNRILLPGRKTKSGQGRFLPIPPSMQSYMDSIPDDCEWVFFRRNPGGGYRRFLAIRSDKGCFATILLKAGIKNFRYHDLRHTAATNLRKKGVRMELVMAIGGWKNVPTFMRYSNYSEEELVGVFD